MAFYHCPQPARCLIHLGAKTSRLPTAKVVLIAEARLDIGTRIQEKAGVFERAKSDDDEFR